MTLSICNHASGPPRVDWVYRLGLVLEVTHVVEESRWAILLARSDLGGQPGITGSELSLNVTGFAGRTPLS